jgi:hypothetical protein
MYIQNEFIELREPLSNDKLAEKLLRILLRKSRWKGYVSALEVMEDVNATFTMDELYTLLRSFVEKLNQAGDCRQNIKLVAFPAQDFVTNISPSSSNFYLSNESFIQILDHKCLNDVMLLSNLFHGMLKFKRKFNKERERKNEKVVCFTCHREGYTI